jgi:HSP20 family molecular chaperone IbpA
MRTEIKYRLILAFSFLCLIGFAGQTLQLWRINDQLAQQNPSKDEIPESIERRLLAELDKKDLRRIDRPPVPLNSPVASFNQIQDYMDSVFAGFGARAFPRSSLMPRNSLSFTSAVPEIELDETDESYQLLIPLTADQELELNTNIEDNAVSVSGVITQKQQQSQNRFMSSFVSQRQFAKTVELPTPINEFGMITEQIEEGIRIIIPKKTG